MSLIVCRLGWFVVVVIGSAFLWPANGMAEVPSALFKAHCLDCHGPGAEDSRLRLDKLPVERTNSDDFAKWVQIYDRVQQGEMPPKDQPQPAKSVKEGFLQSLRQELITAEETHEKQRGRGLVRRLNRTEYENSLRDLLALPLLRVKELLPEDGRQNGFDKVGGALDISHVQMIKYLQAADVALKQAVVRELKAPQTKVWRELASEQYSVQAALRIHCGVPLAGKGDRENFQLASGLTTHLVGNPEKDLGNTYRAATFKGDADAVAVLTGVLGAHQPEGIQIDRFKPEVGGWYRVRFSVWGLRWERTKVAPAVRGTVRTYVSFDKPFFQGPDGKWKYTPLEESKKTREWQENVEFYGETPATHVVRASLKGKPLGFFDAPSLKPTTHEFKVWLNPGEKISFHAMTLPATGASNSGASNGVVDYEGPALAYDWFEVEGPLVEQWPPESQQRLFGKTPIQAFPRPLLANAPTVKRDEPVKLAASDWKGAGQLTGSDRLLNLAGTTTAQVNCPEPGEYELAVTAFETAAGDEAAKMRLSVNGRELPQETFSVNATRSAPQTYRAKFRVDNAGPVQVGVEFLNDFFDEKQPDIQRRDRNLYLSAVEVAAKSLTPAVKSTGEESADSKSLLLSFAERAFRRPVKPEELAPYAGIVEARLAQGASFEEAQLAAYKAVLCSPDFLFLGIEPGAYALASRLSYFLWNSIPDDTLLKLAKSGELSQPKVLRAQAERMLLDPRSDRFVEHFLDEWLEMSKIDFTTPDPQLYPEFDAWLRDSMLAETRSYFRKLLTEDRSVEHLVASDFALVNQRLAELYRIPGVNGSALRVVPLPPESKRGGFLTQAAVLKVTANGTATSPVLRGVWVIERLLGIPRQPPPPNVPAIEPDATGAVTIRQMIEKHRADPVCASCHSKMDPPGLALESFDVIGGLRDRYRLSGQPKKIRKGKEVFEEPSVEVVSGASVRNRIKLRLGSEVDPSGELADGRHFADVNELRRLLLADRDSLARNMVQQLAIYSTGVGLGFRDRPTVEAIVARTRSQNHGLRTILLEVVASELFLKP